MQDTNLSLTSEELQLMQDRTLFDIKQRITGKIAAGLGKLQDALVHDSDAIISLTGENVFKLHGKISRGENYLGYPYLVLDCPRIFEKENVFAFRSMFWWGNHFSYTLHIAGKYFYQVKESFVKNYPSFLTKGIYVCVNDNPWVYHFEKENYLLLENIDQPLLQKIINQDFLKLSIKTELSHWDSISQDGADAFRMFCTILYDR